MQVNKLINWLLFLVLSIIWGSSFILMKHSKEQLSAAQIAALRIFSAGLVFLPLAVFHLRMIPPQKIFVVIMSGITGNLVPAFLFATAIARNIDSSLASILNSLTPIFVVLIAVLVFRDRIKIQKVIGVLLGFAGLALLFLSWRGINFENISYALLILLATVCYGININMVGHFLKSVNPLHVATVSIAFMIIPTGFILWQQDFLRLSFDNHAVSWALIEACALGIVGTAIATAAFYVLINRAGGLFASLVTYGIPLVGSFWGVMDGEHITVKQLGCLGIDEWQPQVVGYSLNYLANVPDTRIDRKIKVSRREKVIEHTG